MADTLNELAITEFANEDSTPESIAKMLRFVDTKKEYAEFIEQAEMIQPQIQQATQPQSVKSNAEDIQEVSVESSSEEDAERHTAVESVEDEVESTSEETHHDEEHEIEESEEKNESEDVDDPDEEDEDDDEDEELVEVKKSQKGEGASSKNEKPKFPLIPAIATGITVLVLISGTAIWFAMQGNSNQKQRNTQQTTQTATVKSDSSNTSNEYTAKNHYGFKVGDSVDVTVSGSSANATITEFDNDGNALATTSGGKTILIKSETLKSARESKTGVFK